MIVAMLLASLAATQGTFEGTFAPPAGHSKLEMPRMPGSRS